ncbi:peroxiredoxin [Sphingomonas sp. R647]|nr:peroxiredoxin [Sphingomonas sp. R647]MCA1198824.1 peroxiredoxin [Sphingomonas sp. R647]
MTESNSSSAAAPQRPLRIGDIAPGFQARSTLGAVRLSDYRGRWLVFFSHPADFTPVCTSEFVSIAKAADAFAALDCGLLGLSVDSLYSHLAWVRAIRQRFGVTIPFPIVEDPSMVIGRAYGMIEPHSDDSSAVRATYFIDPEGVIRAMTWYPLNVGRSVAEMLRMVAALQRTAGNDVLAPEGWRIGDDLLMPPAQDQHAVLAGEDEHWFYRTTADAK